MTPIPYNVNITLTKSGLLFTQDIGSLFNKIMMSVATEIVEKTVEKAREEYIKHRISDNPQSLIIDSFAYETSIKNNSNVVGIVFAGGTIAPYAVYVDRVGWRLKDGGRKSPYEFMAVGAKYGNLIAVKILKKHLKKWFF